MITKRGSPGVYTNCSGADHVAKSIFDGFWKVKIPSFLLHGLRACITQDLQKMHLGQQLQLKRLNNNMEAQSQAQLLMSSGGLILNSRELRTLFNVA